MQTELQQLRDELQQIKVDNSQMQAQLGQAQCQYQQSETRSRNERRRFRVQMALALAAVTGAILLSPTNRAAIAQSTGITLDQVVVRMVRLENKSRYMSVDANGDTYFTGTNVHIVNGDPDWPNGKGNLFVGNPDLRETNDGSPCSHRIKVKGGIDIEMEDNW